MRTLIFVFLCGFLLDGILGIASSPALASLHAALRWSLAAAGAGLFVASAFTTRLPKRVLFPAILFFTWSAFCGGFPLAFIWPEPTPRILAWTQTALAVALLAAHFRRRPVADGPAFSWKNLALLTIFAVVAVPIALAAAVINAAGLSMEAATGGYMKLRPAGILLEERQLAKDGKSVRLVSMMHIGAKDFYDHVQASLPANGRAIVLLEGISDDKELLKSRFSYAKVAKLFGLTAQETSALQRKARSVDDDAAAPEAAAPAGKLEYRRADLDVSAFRPTTIRYINAVGNLLDEPTVERFWWSISNEESPLAGGPDIQQIVMNDILNKRNQHLIAAIDKALLTHEILIVPWGALHLPAIEALLKERGFQETKRLDRPVIKF